MTESVHAQTTMYYLQYVRKMNFSVQMIRDVFHSSICAMIMLTVVMDLMSRTVLQVRMNSMCMHAYSLGPLNGQAYILKAHVQL